MKILMTTDNVGGIWKYSILLAKELKKFDIDVILAIIGFDLKKNELEELENLSWYFKECKQEWMENPWEEIKEAGEWLMDISDKENPDLVHLNSFSFGSLEWNIPVIITFHSCVISWWNEVKKEKITEEWLEYKKNVAEGLKSASFVTAPSKWMLDKATEIYGFNANKKVIYNGLSSRIFHPDRKERYVFSMGRIWDEGKNIKKILEAASCLDYPFYIAGENYYDINVHLPENVYFTGYLPPNEIAEWLSNAAVYLLPVKYEPFGYTLLEAALSGCALVTGNIPSMHELWDDAAIYVDPENEVQIGFEVNNLMNNEKHRKRMAQKAMERAKKYSLDKMLDEYYNLYHELTVYNKKELKTLV